MNITSLEIAQATMDMFFCLFCLIMFVSIKANNIPKGEQPNMKVLIRENLQTKEINISVLTKSPNNALQHRHNLIRYYISTISVCHPKCIERRVKSSLLKSVKISLRSNHTVLLVSILIISTFHIHVIHHSYRE